MKGGDSLKNNKVFRDFPVKGTSFSQFEPEYFLNKDGHLEQYPSLRDCQAFIDSNYETVFQKILEQLMTPVTSDVNPSAEYVNHREALATNLDILLEADSIYDDFKANHPDFVGTRSDMLTYIDNEIKKGYAEYEKAHKIGTQSKQEELPKDGEKSTQA